MDPADTGSVSGRDQSRRLWCWIYETNWPFEGQSASVVPLLCEVEESDTNVGENFGHWKGPEREFPYEPIERVPERIFTWARPEHF